MPFITYDPNTQGNLKQIKGRFSRKVIADKQIFPNIEITDIEMSQYLNDPNNFAVDGDRKVFVANEKSINNFNKIQAVTASKRRTRVEISSELAVNSFVYVPDQALQQNLLFALGIMAHDSDFVCKLWCKNSDGEWNFVEHSVEQCVELAKAFNFRREQLSQKLYKNT